jgi:PHP domain protein
VALGLCASQREVFDHWLVPGKPGYVPQRWASLDEAVSWIRGAGGVAVLAHPARYRLDETRLWALAEHFKAAGGQGIEVVSGGHASADVQRFAGWARRLELAASRASDFHDPVESRFDVGQMPPLPPDLTPIWNGWPELADIRA